MKVVDSFMFSEPYEKELLLIKFEMEDAVVDEWVIIEGAYTFQGEYKGHHIRAILDGDNRFFRYSDRIRVLEVNENFNKLYLMSPLEYLRRYIKHRIPKFRENLVALSEEAGFFAEKNQREAAIEYVLEKYHDRDFVILTDVDEMLDAADKKKRELFLKLLNSPGTCFKLRRKVFVYDFDNLSSRKRYIPIISVAGIQQLKVKSGIAQYVKHRLVWEGMKEARVNEDLFYEFSYCFDKSNIFRKARTFAHTGRGEVDFERALLCNHANKDISLIDHEFIANRENWFERIEVNEKNLPSTIVGKFEHIRTNSVAVDYKEMRQKFYGLHSEVTETDYDNG